MALEVRCSHRVRKNETYGTIAMEKGAETKAKKGCKMILQAQWTWNFGFLEAPLYICHWTPSNTCINVCSQVRGFPSGTSGKESTCLPPDAETWVWSLRQEDPLQEGLATHYTILAWRIPKDRGGWWATVHGIEQSCTRLKQRSMHTTLQMRELTQRGHIICSSS